MFHKTCQAYLSRSFRMSFFDCPLEMMVKQGFTARASSVVPSHHPIVHLHGAGKLLAVETLAVEAPRLANRLIEKTRGQCVVRCPETLAQIVNAHQVKTPLAEPPEFVR